MIIRYHRLIARAFYKLNINQAAALSEKQTHKNQQDAIVRQKSCVLLYDPQLLDTPPADLLSQHILQLASASQRISNAGRGQAWFIEFNGLAAVYRKYLRGGLVARLIKQTYFSLSTDNTRSIKEWRLLQWMHKQGLPVPKPIAASVCRWPWNFSPLYRAQILVQQIPAVQTLDKTLTQRELTSAEWQGIGECIRRFHQAGIYHADLNANNILLDEQSKVYLIDFDKGEQRTIQVSNETWMQENLQRLKRSLLKQQGVHSVYYFSQDNWNLLMNRYR